MYNIDYFCRTSASCAGLKESANFVVPNQWRHHNIFHEIDCVCTWTWKRPCLYGCAYAWVGVCGCGGVLSHDV